MPGAELEAKPHIALSTCTWFVWFPLFALGSRRNAHAVVAGPRLLEWQLCHGGFEPAHRVWVKCSCGEGLSRAVLCFRFPLVFLFLFAAVRTGSNLSSHATVIAVREAVPD